MSMSYGRKGFTLLEVTIVSGLMVFLAVLLSSAWTGVGRSTTDLIARSQLLQEMNLAVAAISRDLGGSLPNPESRLGGKQQGKVGRLDATHQRAVVALLRRGNRPERPARLGIARHRHCLSIGIQRLGPLGPEHEHDVHRGQERTKPGGGCRRRRRRPHRAHIPVPSTRAHMHADRKNTLIRSLPGRRGLPCCSCSSSSCCSSRWWEWRGARWRRRSASRRFGSTQIQCDEGSLHALAHAIHLLETGLPPTSPYVCGVTITTCNGPCGFTVTFTSDDQTTWSVDSRPTQAGENPSPMPADFAPTSP